MAKVSKAVVQRKRDGWLVRDKNGKMNRAIFFCGKDYVPAEDHHEMVRCRVTYTYRVSKYVGERV